MELNNKILFIGPEFYNYHREIILELERRGKQVDFYSEMNQSVLYRIANKLSQTCTKNLEDKHINAILDRIDIDMYDTVFIIRGGYFTPVSMLRLKKLLPKAKFIMYQWDSVEQNNYLPLVPYFDHVQTFDMKDAEKYGISYLPLFYTQQYQQLAEKQRKKKYDLVFFGAYHSNRLDIIKQISAQFEKQGLVFNSHLYITKLALLRLLVKRVITFKEISFFKTFSASSDQIIKTYNETEAVLDVELSIQNGLTIRTFEVLGANLRLVTTNSNIKNESFFDEQRILLVDRHNIQIPVAFFHQILSNNNKYDQFHIRHWLAKNML